MSSGGRLYITLWGGLGDFLKAYYEIRAWRALEDIKKKHPSLYIKAIVYSLNASAKDILTYHPAIDDVFQPKEKLLEVRTKGLPSYAKGLQSIGTRAGLIKSARKSKPRIYLSEEDKKFVADTVGDIGKYVVIHPFSTMPYRLLDSRTAMLPERYTPIIKGLNRNGYKAIILGASRPNSKELFEYEDDNVINLIDKTNARTALNILYRSNGFIGTNSCFMCAAWLEGIKSFIIAPQIWKKRTKGNGFMRQRYKQPQNRVIFLPLDREIANYNAIQQEAVNWFK